MNKINHADIKQWAKDYKGEPFDGILCDPPYELGFMGKSWDSSGIAFDIDMWKSIYDLLKPGGHLLAFSGSRTYHRMAVAIEDAGFEIRDMIEWIYGSGFPKSLNIGKAVDKIGNKTKELINFTKWFDELCTEKGITNKQIDEHLGLSSGGSTASHYRGWNTQQPRWPREELYLVLKTWLDFSNEWDAKIAEVERELIGKQEKAMSGWNMDGTTQFKDRDITKGSSPYEGYGTALKPAHEPCVLARKPIEGTVAQNALKHGTGGLNIDGTRVGTDLMVGGSAKSAGTVMKTGLKADYKSPDQIGRFPANLIHDGSDEVVGLFPDTGSSKFSKQTRSRKGFMLSGSEDNVQEANAPDNYGDSGSAARFFYCAKASKSERNAGLEGFEPQITNDGREKDIDNALQRGMTLRTNHHPTVKPLSLTKYLANLIKPPTGGRLLVPFSGSGSEMIGALQAGWEYVEGVEITEEYIPIAEARIKYWLEQMAEADKQIKLV